MNRRGFLGGILAACAAPAIVKAELLMPVRKIVVPNETISGLVLLQRAEEKMRPLLTHAVCDPYWCFVPVSLYEEIVEARGPRPPKLYTGEIGVVDCGIRFVKSDLLPA